MTAIVTCSETRSSLAAVRALGRAGIPVAAGGIRRPSLSMWSRYASSTFLTEDPALFSQKFVESLADELKARYAICALASSDEAYWALSRYREYLPASAKRLLPPHYSVVRSLDHEALHQFAQSLGIACAELLRIAEDTPVKDISELMRELEYPLLIRPIVSWADREDGKIKRSPIVIRSSKGSKKLLKNAAWVSNGFLVSTYQGSRSVAYFGVADKGRVLADGFQERLHELEPHKEIATFSKTIGSLPHLRSSCQILLAALQWQGPYKIEFIKDKRGGYRLLSLIGRLWGSVQLAIHAKVNIPLLCYQMAQGHISEELLITAEKDIALRWLIGDVASKFNNPSSVLFGLKSAFKRGSTRSLKTYNDVFDLKDPMPFVFELQNKTWKKAFSD